MNSANDNSTIAMAMAMAISFLISIAAIGCDNAATQQSPTKETKVPKLMFHLPKTTPVAVARIRELFDVVMSEKELPKPISYRVLEVIHGTGVAAHSHFLPIDETNSDESKKQAIDDHGHETTGEVTHTITVDIFNELSDLARRLPNIAIVGDMEEQTWLKVKKSSSKLSDELDLAFEGQTSDQEKRNAIRNHAENISDSIEQLEKLVSQSSQTNKKDK